MEKRAKLIEATLARISAVQSEAKQARAETEALRAVCAERDDLISSMSRELEVIGDSAAERAGIIEVVSRENAMLLETLAERSAVIDAMTRENGMLLRVAAERAEIIGRLQRRNVAGRMRGTVARALRALRSATVRESAAVPVARRTRPGQ